MFEQKLDEFSYMSLKIGERVDYVQGGGGNTSVKLNDRLMAIKASGYRLNEIKSDSGFVAIDYSKIRQYHNFTPKGLTIDYNKESMDIALSTITQVNKEPRNRPSVEAGFHSFLDTFVLHTHSVYANVLACTEEGDDILKRVLGNKGYEYVVIPYVMPGYYLTESIVEQINTYYNNNKKSPKVFVMKNHGLIVTGDNHLGCLQLHENINKEIKIGLSLPNFTEPKIQKVDDETYKSATDWLIEVLSDQHFRQRCLETPIYPDQLVYLFESEIEGKIVFLPDSDDIVYKTNEKEALIIEETLLGVAYVMFCIEKASLTIKPMNIDQVDKILNWDSEKIRKKMIAVSEKVGDQ